MSSIMCSKRHLSMIIDAGIHLTTSRSKLMWRTDSGYFNLTRETASAAVRTLELANIAAAADLYPDEPPIEPHYTWECVSRLVDPVGVIKLIQSYEYQCCDWPGWETSEARRACAAIRRLCETCLPGYAEAPWIV